MKKFIVSNVYTTGNLIHLFHLAENLFSSLGSRNISPFLLHLCHLFVLKAFPSQSKRCPSQKVNCQTFDVIIL